MRNTIVILLLILFTGSQVGYFCVYSFQQNKIKNEVKVQMKNMLQESSLQIIVAEENAGTLKWQEEGKEFMLHGELYDVAKMETVNGKTLLYCINDKKEEKLLQKFLKAIKSATNNNTNSKNGKTNCKFQTNHYWFFYNKENITAINADGSWVYLSYISSLISSVKEVIAPPPRV